MFISWLSSWVSPTWYCLLRRWQDVRSSKCRWSFCWGCLSCILQTTNHLFCRRRSCHQSTRHCPTLEYWTSFRLTEHLYDPLTLKTSWRCRHLHCIQPQSGGTYQLDHWWRTSSIQPSTTDHLYAWSTHHRHHGCRGYGDSHVEDSHGYRYGPGLWWIPMGLWEFCEDFWLGGD